jgi:hypothetical protein
MNKHSKATSFGTWWSLIAGGVMVAENPEKVHIFLPHEILKVETIDNNLIVTVRPHMKRHNEREICSFTLNPKLVLPSVAERAQNADLPIALYAALEIRSAKDEQQRENQRLHALSQSFCREDVHYPEHQSLSVARDRVFMIFPILSAALFAAMLYYGHGRRAEHILFPAHPTKASRQPRTVTQPPITISEQSHN